MKNTNCKKEEMTQFVEFLLNLDIGEKIPYIWGKSGIGKSYSIQEYFSKKEIKIVRVNLSAISIADIQVQSVYNDKIKKMENKAPAWLNVLLNHGDKEIVLMLDEVDKITSPSVKAMLLDVLRERRVNEFKLGENVKIVCLGNRLFEEEWFQTRMIQIEYNGCDCNNCLNGIMKKLKNILSDDEWDLGSIYTLLDIILKDKTEELKYLEKYVEVTWPTKAELILKLFTSYSIGKINSFEEMKKYIEWEKNIGGDGRKIVGDLLRNLKDINSAILLVKNIKEIINILNEDFPITKSILDLKEKYNIENFFRVLQEWRGVDEYYEKMLKYFAFHAPNCEHEDCHKAINIEEVKEMCDVCAEMYSTLKRWDMYTEEKDNIVLSYYIMPQNMLMGILIEYENELNKIKNNEVEKMKVDKMFIVSPLMMGNKTDDRDSYMICSYIRADGNEDKIHEIARKVFFDGDV